MRALSRLEIVARGCKALSGVRKACNFMFWLGESHFCVFEDTLAIYGVSWLWLGGIYGANCLGRSP